MGRGYRVAYIDSEKSLNPIQMKIYGLTKYYEEGLLLHFDKIITMKQCDEVNAALVDDGSIKLIIIDSETELLAKDVDDIDVEGKTIGEHARQSAAMLNKLKCMVHENNLIAIVMFQARANIQPHRVSVMVGYSANPVVRCVIVPSHLYIGLVGGEQYAEGLLRKA